MRVVIDLPIVPPTIRFCLIDRGNEPELEDNEVWEMDVWFDRPTATGPVVEFIGNSLDEYIALGEAIAAAARAEKLAARGR